VDPHDAAALEDQIRAEIDDLPDSVRVLKIVRTYRPAIDLVAERARQTLLGKVLLRLDDDPELVDRPELRAEIERTLVAALDGSR